MQIETWSNTADSECPDILFSREPTGEFLYQCGEVVIWHTGNEINIVSGATLKGIKMPPHVAEQLLTALTLMAQEHNLCPLPRLSQSGKGE